MRNHAGAAQANQVDLTGLQLVSRLETCTRQVITLPQDPMRRIRGRLLRNINADRLGAPSPPTLLARHGLPYLAAQPTCIGVVRLHVRRKRVPS